MVYPLIMEHTKGTGVQLHTAVTHVRALSRGPVGSVRVTPWRAYRSH